MSPISQPLGLREARQLSRRLQNDLAGGLARGFGTIPEPRVRQLMHTPARRLVLDAVFRALPRVLAGTRAAEVTTCARCHVTGRSDGGFDIYWVEFSDGRWRTGRGAHEREPELTVTIDATELLMLASRRSSPVQAYLSGRLRASGNPVIAARLTTLFRNAAAPAPAVGS